MCFNYSLLKPMRFTLLIRENKPRLDSARHSRATLPWVLSLVNGLNSSIRLKLGGRSQAFILLWKVLDAKCGTRAFLYQ